MSAANVATVKRWTEGYNARNLAGVLMVAVARWRGKASGAEGHTPIFVACWLRAEKIFRLEVFTERAPGFHAVGLG